MEVGGSPKNQNNKHQRHHMPTYHETSATDGDVKSQHTRQERTHRQPPIRGGGKKSKKPQQSEGDETDSTVPDTTKSLQDELTKIIKEQWELKETLKEQQVQIERLTRDLNKSQFEVARQPLLAFLAQRNARGAILKNIELHRKLDEIHQVLKAPERVSVDEIFIASMTWHTD